MSDNRIEEIKKRQGLGTLYQEDIQYYDIQFLLKELKQLQDEFELYKDLVRELRGDLNELEDKAQRLEADSRLLDDLIEILEDEGGLYLSSHLVVTYLLVGDVVRINNDVTISDYKSLGQGTNLREVIEQAVKQWKEQNAE